MLTLTIPRGLLGAGAVLIAGLAVGCGHCQQCQQAAHPMRDGKGSCATCAALPPVTAKAPTATATAAPPAALPLTALPPVSNERYIPANNPVTSAKPNFDDSLVKSVPQSLPAGQAEMGHAPDYSWLVGELNFMPHKNQWRLRFAAIDVEDKYGGSVTLDGGNHLLKECHTGMMVRVEGMMVDKDAREPSPKFYLRGMEPVGK